MSTYFERSALSSLAAVVKSGFGASTSEQDPAAATPQPWRPAVERFPCTDAALCVISRSWTCKLRQKEHLRKIYGYKT